MTDPATDEQIAEITERLAKATPGPWGYRSQENDDWGYVRGPKLPDGWSPIAAIGRAGRYDVNENAHRKAGTDPYGPNAAFIAAARNLLPALLSRIAATDAARVADGVRIAELERTAKSLSDALLTVRPLGGSELFAKVGDTFYADPKYCAAVIEESHKSLHEARCAKIRAERERDTLRADKAQLLEIAAQELRTLRADLAAALAMVEDAGSLLDEARSNHVAGSRPDMEWDQQRDEFRRTALAAKPDGGTNE